MKFLEAFKRLINEKDHIHKVVQKIIEIKTRHIYFLDAGNSHQAGFFI